MEPSKKKRIGQLIFYSFIAAELRVITASVNLSKPIGRSQCHHTQCCHRSKAQLKLTLTLCSIAQSCKVPLTQKTLFNSITANYRTVQCRLERPLVAAAVAGRVPIWYPSLNSLATLRKHRTKIRRSILQLIEINCTNVALIIAKYSLF